MINVAGASCMITIDISLFHQVYYCMIELVIERELKKKYLYFMCVGFSVLQQDSIPGGVSLRKQHNTK